MRFQQEKQETQIHKNPSCGPLFPKTWRCGRLLFRSHFWVPKMAQKRGLKVTHVKQKHKESVLNKCQVVQFLDPFLGPISGPRNGSKIGPLFYRKNVLQALELHAPCCGATVRQVCQCPIPCTDSRLSFEEEGEPCLPSLSATACHEPILRWITCLGSTCPIAREGPIKMSLDLGSYLGSKT